jgi:hypothetical protein
MDVLVWTLEQTEAWAAREQGSIFPLPPQALKKDYQPTDFTTINLTVTDIIQDLRSSLALMRQLNPKLKVILFVSPVPQLLTIDPARHILAANCYAKSALRAAAQEVCDSEENVFYFPAYEIISSPYTAGLLYRKNLREISPAGLNLIKRLFLRHFAETEATGQVAEGPFQATDSPGIVCDDLLMGPEYRSRPYWEKEELAAISRPVIDDYPIR